MNSIKPGWLADDLKLAAKRVAQMDDAKVLGALGQCEQALSTIRVGLDGPDLRIANAAIKAARAILNPT